MSDDGKTTTYVIQQRLQHPLQDPMPDDPEASWLWQDVAKVTVPQRTKRSTILEAAREKLGGDEPLRALDEASAEEYTGTPRFRFV